MKTTIPTRSSRPPGPAWRVLVGAASLVALHAAHAGPGSTPSTDLLGILKQMPVYYANSPSGVHTVINPNTGATNAASNSGTPMRKFVDPLPNFNAASPTCGVPAMVTNAQAIAAPVMTVPSCIPLAVPDTTTYPGSDYYVIGVVEYAQQMHSDLPKATALRGYTQLNNPTYPAPSAVVTDPLNAQQTYTTYTAWPQPVYLGPIIVAARDRPVRVKYVNLLPSGRATFAAGGQPSCEIVTVGGTTAATNTTALTYTNGSIATWNNAGPGGYSSPGTDIYAGIPEVAPATIPPTYQAGTYTFCETIANAPVATARNGDLMVPNDLTIRGAGAGENQAGTADCGGYASNTLPGVMQAADPVKYGKTAAHGGVCLHTLNRAEVHLHGGMSPWISDGTPHQWTVPAAETDPAVTQLGRVGESFHNVPDMPDPGPGAGTLFWTNQQSARLMFYHDHTSGLTRTNVYVGEAAGYVLRDPIEATLENGGTIPANAAAGLAAVTVPAGTIPLIGIPLVIEDKTFVPVDIAAQDPLWSTTWWGAPGDLWYPHVYETNQDPYSITGSNNAGRWDYGQWFFPPMNPSTLRGPIPQPSLAPEGFMDTPVINGVAYPVLHVNAGLTRFRILAVPNERTNNLSWFVADTTAGNTGFGTASVDTEVKMLPASPPVPVPAAPVAGTVYRCQAANGNYAVTPIVDPANNIDSTLFGGQPMAVLDSTGAPLNGTGLPRQGMSYVTNNTAANGLNHTMTATGTDGGACWPASWPTDGRDGGVPDPTNAGPAWIHIGTEGGFLPQPLVIPPTPLGYEYNRRSVSVLNSYYHGLYLGPAERADVLVDFSQFAGKTLILYNDAPAPNPGFDARNDYYTGDVDQTAGGGSQPTLAGYGPNTRTIMQVVVDGTGGLGSTATPLTGAALSALSNTILPAAFAASQPAPIIGEPGFSPAYPVAATVTATALKPAVLPAGAVWPANSFVQQYGKIGDHNVSFYTAAQPAAAGTGITTAANGLTKLNAYESSSATVPQPAGNVLQGSSAIHEIFDTDYGRMNSVEGYEMPATNFLTQTTVPLQYIDAASDMFKEGETQIWKVTHNGVDTHAIHFHLLNLQVLNRVGWDGTIRPPDPDEVGWKETIKMNPLEDIFLAFQAVKPELPFNLPDSTRRYDPTTMVGSTANFTNPPGGEFPYIPPYNCNGLGGGLPTAGCTDLSGLKAPVAPATADVNTVGNFGWEYVWHCHLLGHEENDMMRPLVMSVDSTVPTMSGAITGAGNAGNATAVPPVQAGMTVTWVDPTPIVYAAATSTAVWPYLTVATAGPGTLPLGTVNLGNPANEIGFKVYGIGVASANAAVPPLGAGWTLLGTAGANSTSFHDTTLAIQTGSYYAYAVVAFNQAGDAAPLYSAPIQQTAAVGPPQPPATLTVTPNAPLATSSMTLAWTMPSVTSPATGYNILRCSAASPTGSCTTAQLNAIGPVLTFTDVGVVPNATYCYQVSAFNVAGTSAAALATPTCATTPALPPAAPSSVTAAFTPMQTNLSAATPFGMTVNWTGATGGPTGYVVQSCVTGCTNAGAGTWTNTTTQPAGLALMVGDSKAQGALVMYRVQSTGSLNSYIGGVAQPAVAVSSAWTYSTALQLAVIPAATTAPVATPDTTGTPAVALAWTVPAPAANAAPTSEFVNRTQLPAPGITTVLTMATAATTAYTDTPLAAGTSYSYTISAQNVAGTATSAPATVVTTAIVIPAPGPLVLRPVTGNPAYNSVQLQWINNATTQTGFPVYRALSTGTACPAVPAGMTTATASGGWQFLNTASGVGFGGGATVRYTDATVGPATGYCYVVQAINGTTYSLPSNVLRVTTPAITISAPTTPTVALAAGTTAGAGPTVTVGWSWTRGGGATATRFDILRFNGTTYVTVGTVLGCGGGGGGCTRTFADTTPVQGSVTSYQIMAVNVTGGVQTFSTPLTTANVTIPALPTVPAITSATPVAAVTVGAGSRSVTLVWTGASAANTAQVVQASTSPTLGANGLFATTIRNVAQPVASSTATINVGSRRNVVIYFLVRETNAAGFVTSTVVSATTAP